MKHIETWIFTLISQKNKKNKPKNNIITCAVLTSKELAMFLFIQKVWGQVMFFFRAV